MSGNCAAVLHHVGIQILNKAFKREWQDVMMFIDDSNPPAEAGGHKSSITGSTAGSGQLVHMSQPGASTLASTRGNGGGGTLGRGAAGYGAGGLGTGGLVPVSVGGSGRSDPYYRCAHVSRAGNRVLHATRKEGCVLLRSSFHPCCKL